MLNEIFPESLENFKITRICMENHAGVTGWQKLFLSYKCFKLSTAVSIATFEIIGLKILRLPNFNMLFQLVLIKFCQVMQRAYQAIHRMEIYPWIALSTF